MARHILAKALMLCTIALGIGIYFARSLGISSAISASKWIEADLLSTTSLITLARLILPLRGF